MPCVHLRLPGGWTRLRPGTGPGFENRKHRLPITRQAQALGIARSTVYTLPRPVSDRDLHLMKLIDRFHLETPFAGSRMLRDLLALARPVAPANLHATRFRINSSLPLERSLGHFSRAEVGHYGEH